MKLFLDSGAFIARALKDDRYHAAAIGLGQAMPAQYTLFIGSKNLSSWSLRPWLAMKMDSNLTS